MIVVEPIESLRYTPRPRPELRGECLPPNVVQVDTPLGKTFPFVRLVRSTGIIYRNDSALSAAMGVAAGKGGSSSGEKLVPLVIHPAVEEEVSDRTVPFRRADAV